MKPMHLVLLAGLAAATATAFAADKPPKFKDVDANGDGSVDATEFAAATAAGVKQAFEKLDKNGDGTLTRQEYAVVMGDADCE